MSTLSPIHPQAMNMINKALGQVVRRGRKAERMQLYVCPRSELAQHQIINTAFGNLRICTSEYLSKGYSYIREDLIAEEIGFAWVSYPKTANITENRRKEA